MHVTDRLVQKYKTQNPVREHQRVFLPDWVLAVAEVLEEQQREINKLRAAIEKGSA